MSRLLTGTRIRERRLDRGLRQAAVAEAVGVSPSYLNLIEHNRRRIGGKLLADLARVLEVDAAQLTEGANADLIEQLRVAAMTYDGLAEVDKIDELAARYPGWGTLITQQARRLADLETRIQGLSDRFTHDPKLADVLHEMISSVTAIRSSASILVGQEQVDADWQRRFHQNIHEDSLRLADQSEAFIDRLTAPETVSQSASAIDEVETYLAKTGFHLAALEADPASTDEVVAEADPDSPEAEQLLRNWCVQYVEDARALPLANFAAVAVEAAYDPLSLVKEFDAPVDRVLRRLASLPEGAKHPPMGLAICDPSGALVMHKPVSGFRWFRNAERCPLWPVFGAFSQPGRLLRLNVETPSPATNRFLCYAIAVKSTPESYDLPTNFYSTMLVFPDPPDVNAQIIDAGPSCSICPRQDCTARRLPAVYEWM